MNKELSIYVHIPFCQRKCLYCDFLSFNANEDLITDYFKALKREICFAAEEYEDYIVRTIFFGGGTPSFADSKSICNILNTIRESFKVSDDAEISIEVNPASAICGKLTDYKKSGINRLSIGAQSFDDGELQRLGRLHNSRMIIETYDNARRAGFDNINLDIMSALPGQNFEAYMKTLSGAVRLLPEHISAYSLIVEEGTPFFDMELHLPSEDEDRKMYHETGRFLAEHGYNRYEISNYARGKEPECRHNRVYWTRGNYLGVGLGAASMVKNVRWSNTRNIKVYVRTLSEEDISQNSSGLNISYNNQRGRKEKSDLYKIRENVERLPVKSQMEEFMFLGLRLTEGISTNKFRQEFNTPVEDVYGEVIDKYIEMGLLEYAERGSVIVIGKAGQMHDNKNSIEESREIYLRMTKRGLDVSNTVMADFIL